MILHLRILLCCVIVSEEDYIVNVLLNLFDILKFFVYL